MQIKDRVAVITGGASGLGLGCVRNIVANGGKVAIFDINETAANAIVEELGADKVMAVATNIAEEDSVKAGIEAVMAKFGRIDIAINSAGIGSAVKIYNQKTDEVHPLDVFQRVINVDLIGTFNVMRYAVQQMYKNEPTEDGERGVVINTSSTAAVEGGIGQAAYSAAKGGVLGLTVPCARELGRIGIRVMAILPACSSLLCMIALMKRFWKTSSSSPFSRNALVIPASLLASASRLLKIRCSLLLMSVWMVALDFSNFVILVLPCLLHGRTTAHL